jgi:hypothetical protein
VDGEEQEKKGGLVGVGGGSRVGDGVDDDEDD